MIFPVPTRSRAMQLGPPAQHLATGTARLGFLLQSRRLACPTQLAFAREGYSREQRSLSIQEGDALLASQFHPKNAPLRPEDVRLGSNKDVLWLCKCQKCGHPHEWAASPERRFTLGEFRLLQWPHYWDKVLQLYVTLPTCTPHIIHQAS